MKLSSVVITDDSEWQVGLKFGPYFVGWTYHINCRLEYGLLNILFISLLERLPLWNEAVWDQIFLVDLAEGPNPNLLIMYLADWSADVEDSQHYAVEAECNWIGGNGAFVAHRYQPHLGPGR